ncbi:hypothetical protein IWW39_003968 [Coemansia spiralis]|uniref:Queuine tRNA-ribosyltransferase accessory subunit 2 n=1 Tax=Coemansia spiralis TaxID=417178 RepID=A0A9W8L3S9_9FUNG|nr:hypothetical protein IWW39_003968 [Coemansia spiralis]
MALRFELAGAKASGLAAPRRGRLVLHRLVGKDAGVERPAIVLETPAFFKYTRHGLQPHLVPEVAAEVDALPPATRVQIEDFFDSDAPDCSRFEEGLHKFIALDTAEILMLDTLDPTISVRTAKPANTYMAIGSEAGTKRLTPDLFAQLANSLKPDIVIPLADIVEEPLPSLTQGKRISKSVTRSAKWLDECTAALTYPAAVFAPVVGSHSLELRTMAAKALAARHDIAGYAFNDVCLTLPMEQKLNLVQHSLELLDASKPRYMLGASAPDSVLCAVLRGIDLFDSSYPYAVTELGLASTYVLGSDGPAKPLPYSLDLWQDAMFADFGPLVEGCTCFTCRSHHRSYVHHLLKTKEMLATVLLQIHNMHWYQRFFDDIRRSLEQGTLPADAALFLQRYNCKEKPFSELDTLAAQACSPTTKIQRKRHAESQKP